MADERTVTGGRPVRVLVMDDEESILKVVERALTKAGHVVEVALHGRRALDLYVEAMEKGEAFDVVLLDLTVPNGAGGVEIAGKIREIDKDAKIVASSGRSSDPVMTDCRRYGFTAALIKPFNIQELKDKVREALNA